ncbi:MAG TPA: hypothetical protein VGM26_12035 [Rhizomicrobium sp.]|jgi:hypothetical protein
MIRYGLIVALACAAPGLAQAADLFARCDGLSDAARLACYDAVRGARRPEPAAHPMPMTAPAPHTFTRLTAPIIKFNFNAGGKFIITLDNGQIWRQFDADISRAKFRTDGRNIVTVTPGFWGSYDLKINDMNAVFKAERIR